MQCIRVLPRHGVQPAFWVLDLMARYQVNQKLSVNLNIRNALDKSYFAGIRDFGRVQYTWGAPRSVTASRGVVQSQASACRWKYGFSR